MNELKLGNSTNMGSSTNKDNSEEKLVRINYRSDFPLAVRLNNFSIFPDYNFELRATVDNEVKSYCVEKKDGVCKNCKVQDDLLIIFFNNHGLSTGRLKIEMILYIPDSSYADGFKQEYYSATTSILLVEGNSDPIDDTIPSTPNSPGGSIQLTDLANAVKDIQDKIKELQATTSGQTNEKDYSKFDKVIKGINYRGWTGLGAAQDTLDAYKDSFAMGFRYVGVVVHKTSDDKFIIGYDERLPDRLVNPATGAKGSTVKIEEHTLEELKAFKDTKDGTVTELSEFCKLCKTYGLHPYIEIKKPLDEAVMYKILDIITRSGLNYNFTILSYYKWPLESSIKYDDKIRIGFLYRVMSDSVDSAVTSIDKIKAKSTNRINVFLYADSQYFKTPSEAVMTKLLANKLPLEVFVVDTEADVLALDPYVSGAASNTIHAGKVLQDKR